MAQKAALAGTMMGMATDDDEEEEDKQTDKKDSDDGDKKVWYSINPISKKIPRNIKRNF